MNTRTRAFLTFALTAALLLIAAPAFAHVTVRTDNPAPEAFAKYTIRVPNETEDAATTKIEVQFPEGFTGGNYQPKPGWDISVSETGIVIEGGAIEPGQFEEFSFSAQNPAETGDLTFPAIQTYDDGEEVRWIGEPDADEPAPVVTIEGEAGGHGHGGADDEASEASEVAAAATEAPAEDAEPTASAGGTDTVSVVALLAALLALVLGGAALARGRR